MDMRRADVLRDSPRMFESDILDRLSRVHPVVPLIVFIPAIAILFALGSPSFSALGILGLVLAGYAFWTLFEYWIHRLVFHFEPDFGWGQRLHWIIHGVHHDHPNDPLRLVMPPSVSIPLGLIMYGLFTLVLGAPAAQVFASGFFAGYLVYDMTHYYVHHRRPKTRLGKLLRELHMRHHFQDETRGFGISAPFWDYVFGTRLQRSR
ncbi:MAG TPA: sterol desaturase family protein [Thermoleophilaceae bacterium]|jgi:sterol desaturase/sphingolipid hydroxylase (fatty acid hydroxylase superfamily)